MELFMLIFAPGMLVCWIFLRKHKSWARVALGIFFGVIASYGAMYALVSYPDLNQQAALHFTAGKTGGDEVLRAMHVSAFKGAVASIIGGAIAIKLRSRRFVDAGPVDN